MAGSGCSLPSTARGRGPARAIFLGEALLGAILVILNTEAYGLGMSPDTGAYVAASRSLLASGAFVQFDGTPFVRWPPLFVLLLAILGGTGTDALVLLRWVHAGAFGAVVYCSGMASYRLLKTRALAVPVSTIVCFSPQLVEVASWALSEILFILLVTLLLFHVPFFINQESPRGLLALSTLALLANLQRYAGVTLTATALLVVVGAPRATHWKRRLASAVLLLLVAVGPLALWLFRNVMIAGTITRFAGPRSWSPFTLEEALQVGCSTIGTWAAPGMDGGLGVILLGGIGVILLGLGLTGPGRHKPYIRRWLQPTPLSPRVLVLLTNLRLNLAKTDEF